jgi:hypothetical protein
MTFRLHIPGRLETDPPPVANPANPLIEGQPVAANDAAAADRISGIAGLAGGETREADHDDDHEAKAERSAVISADGVPYWEADDLAGLPAWTDDEIASFEKRVARITWLGYGNAKGRAEMLLHRDRGADDRRLCVECQHAGPGWRCARREAFMLDQLQRCPMFKEKPL